jgi:nicotinamide riboside transporter PnuC
MSVPDCNMVFNGKDIYSSTASGVGSGVGGFIGLIFNSTLFVILFLIYLLSGSYVVLFFALCFLFGSIYSYYQMTSGGVKLPERPCKKNGEILN